MIIIGYTVLDLFCGAGGMSEGFRQNGFEIVCGIDNDPDVCKTHRRNFPESVTIEGDITQLNVEKIKESLPQEIDIIIGGFPCQGFSMAGKRWVDDPRNQLFKEFVRFVEGFRPKVFVAENVAGLVSMANGRFVEEIKESFNNIGYKVEVQILNSAEYGVPQRRERAIFIGTYEGKEITFPEPLYIDNFISVKEAIDDLPFLNNDFGRNTTICSIKSTSNYQEYLKGRLSFEEFVQGSTSDFINEEVVLHNHWTSKSRDKTLERFRYINIGENWEALPDHLKTNGKYSNLYRRLHPDKPSVTLTNIRKSMFIHPYEDRLLTVREGARIQSFPDYIVFEGTLGSQQQQIGNAVPPLLGYAIAKHLLETML